MTRVPGTDAVEVEAPTEEHRALIRLRVTSLAQDGGTVATGANLSPEAARNMAMMLLCAAEIGNQEVAAALLGLAEATVGEAQ